MSRCNLESYWVSRVLRILINSCLHRRCNLVSLGHRTPLVSAALGRPTKYPRGMRIPFKMGWHGDTCVAHPWAALAYHLSAVSTMSPTHTTQQGWHLDVRYLFWDGFKTLWQDLPSTPHQPAIPRASPPSGTTLGHKQNPPGSGTQPSQKTSFYTWLQLHRIRNGSACQQ
jgi:hypothetical protein